MTIGSKEVLADVTARVARLPAAEALELGPQLTHLRETFAWLNLSRSGRTSPPSVAIVFGLALGYFAQVVAEVENAQAEPLSVADEAVRA